MVEGVGTGSLQGIAVVIETNEMKAGRNPLILRPTRRSKARKIGTGNGILDDFDVASFGQVCSGSCSGVVSGCRAFNDAPQVVKMQVAGFSPRKSLVVAAFIGSDKEDTTQMWVQRFRALQTGVGDDVTVHDFPVGLFSFCRLA